jgi:di/tricarboxylate transporter
MTIEMWVAILILFSAIVLFITEWLRVDIVAIGVMVSLMLTGLVTTQEALSGFSNPAVLTIASLFVIGGAIMQTGLAGIIGQRILKIAGTKPGRLTFVIMLTVGLLSAFMSDAGTVAVLLPAIISLGISANISPSKLLIPLSYGSLLGGATTLIGTPPNIIVSDLLREEGLKPFGFFDYTPIGICLFAAGIIFILLIGRRMLPDYQPQQNIQRIATPQELVDIYRLPDNLFRLRVRRNSSLVGQEIEMSGLRKNFNLTILRINRPQKPRQIAHLGDTQLVLHSEGYETFEPSPEFIFQKDDILIVQGTPDDVTHSAAALNLGVQPAQAVDDYSLITNEAGIAEILLPPRSSLVGKTIVDVNFGKRYHITVLGIRRPGTDETQDLKDTQLSFGDTLLVLGSWKNILELRSRRRDFVILGQPEEMLTAPARKKAPLALLIMAAMLVMMVTNLLPVSAASMTAALMMVLSGCVSIDEAYEAIDWKSIVLIAGMIPMSIALENVGLVKLIASVITEYLGGFGPVVVLSGLFIMTSLFTQFLSNTATTVLIAPIGLVAAQQLNIQPYAFLMAISIAASMAFATPVASPVNTLVMGAGSYRFKDFIKVGVPMILVVLVVSLLVLPVFWPF